MNMTSIARSGGTRARSLVLGGLAVGLLGGLLAWMVVGTKYEGASSVVVNPVTSQPFDASDPVEQLSMRTQVKVGESQQLANRVAKRLGVSGADLTSGLTVTNPSQTTALRFAYTGPDPQFAAEAANAFAEEYLAERQETARATATTLLNALSAEAEALEKQTEQLTRQLQRADRFEATVLRGELSVLVNQSQSVNTRRLDVLSLIDDPGRVLTRAELPLSPATPGLLVWLLLGTLGGLALGAFMVWLVPIRKQDWWPWDQSPAMGRLEANHLASEADNRQVQSVVAPGERSTDTRSGFLLDEAYDDPDRRVAHPFTKRA